jgi:cyclopropane fatty-acyl-phospholipid synthase-like methyltransferase
MRLDSIAFARHLLTRTIRAVVIGTLLQTINVAHASASTCESLFDSTVSYYNSNAIFYNQSRGHESPEFKRQREIFEGLLRPGARILEIGAGHGRDALHFINRGYQVVATEPAEELAKLAEEKIRQRVLRLRAQDIDFNGEFDAIWATASLIHVPPNEMALTFAKFRKALKVGGILQASFLTGIGTADLPETIPDGRYFNRASENFLRDIVHLTPGLRIVEKLTNHQKDDYFKKAAPSSVFGFFNLYVVRDY